MIQQQTLESNFQGVLLPFLLLVLSKLVNPLFLLPIQDDGQAGPLAHYMLIVFLPMSEEDIVILLSALENINICRQQIDREERDILCQLHSLSSQWPGALRGSTASQAAAVVSAHTFSTGQHVYISTRDTQMYCIMLDAWTHK